MDCSLKEKLFRITCLVSDVDASYHQAALKLGLPDSVCVVLYMLYMNGFSCSLNDIYRLSGISKQTINSALRRLEGEGIVYLEQLDGKAKRVCAAEGGRAYIEETAGRILGAEMRALGTWEQEEIDRLICLLEKYNASFKGQIEKL